MEAPEPSSTPPVDNDPSEAPEASVSPESVHHPDVKAQIADAPLGHSQPRPISATVASYGPNWPKRIGLSLLVICLAAVAVGLVLRYAQPKQQSATAVVKHEIPVLKVGVQDPLPTSLYPNTPDGSSNSEIDTQIFSTLTALTNNTKVVGDLATSWTNPNNSTWDFNIRSGVYYHNGDPVTAQSIADSLNATATSGSEYWTDYGSTIKTVTAPNSQTVQITTNGPDPLLANELTELSIFDTKKHGSNPDSSDGSGAYQLKPGTTLNGKSVDLVAYNQYYGGKPYVQELDYIYYDSDQAVAAALKAGQIDLGSIQRSSVVAQAGPGVKVQPVWGPEVTFLVPNTLRAGSPLAKLAVRQAIYESLDPAALASANGDEGTTPATQAVPQQIPGFDPSIKRPAFNPVAGKAALAAAGYPNGFTITFTYFSSAQAIATEVQKELGAIGITLKMDPQTDGNALAAKAFGGGTDLFYVSDSTSLIDSSDVLGQLVLSANNFSNSQLTALSNQSQTILNPTQRIAVLQQENRLVMSNLALFPLYDRSGLPYVGRDDLQMHQQTIETLTGLYFWQVYAQ